LKQDVQSRRSGIVMSKRMRKGLGACMLALIAGSAAAAAPVVYVTALNTTYTVNSTCAPTDFSCTTAQPVGHAARSAFIGELKKKGLQVVAAAPEKGKAFRISTTLRNLEVKDSPAKDGHYEGHCEATGLVLGGRIPPGLSELDLRHRLRLSAANIGPDKRLSPAGMENAIAMCLRRQAHWIAEIVRKYP
jgi:hypothetical protein